VPRNNVEGGETLHQENVVGLGAGVFLGGHGVGPHQGEKLWPHEKVVVVVVVMGERVSQQTG
jgi:hypothetical protein